MKKLVYLFLTIILAAGLWSCVKETAVDPPEDGTTALSFKINVPKDAYVTRGIAGANEWDIKTLDVYVAEIGGNVNLMTAGTDYTISPAIGGTAKNYTITIADKWLNSHAGDVVNFYFVGNNVSSGDPSEWSDGHQELKTKTTEATFKNALTNSLQRDDLWDIIHKPDNTHGLLFSAVTKPITVAGILQENAQLKRRAARFDIQNDYKNDFVVTKIVVERFASQGLIFANGDISAVTIPHPGNAVVQATPGSGVVVADYTEDAPGSPSGTKNLAPSVFYLYPTIMSDWEDDTMVTVYGKLNSGPELPYPVSITGNIINVRANFRYIITVDPYGTSVMNQIGEIEDGGNIVATIPPRKSMEILETRNFDDPYQVHHDWNGELERATDLWEAGEKTAYIVSDRAASTFSILVGIPGWANNTTSKTEYLGGNSGLNVVKTDESTASDGAFLYTFTVPADSGEFYARCTIHPTNSGTQQSGDPLVFYINKLWGGDDTAILGFSGDKFVLLEWEADLESTENHDSKWRDKLAYFKFGSVIGFDMKNATFNIATDIKVNPSSYTTGAGKNITGYTNENSYNQEYQNALPYIPGYVPSDFKNFGITNVSSPEYTNAANIRKGKGDPCMLAGYSAGAIRNMSDQALDDVIENARWRLPTVRENAYFAGNPANYRNNTQYISVDDAYRWQNPEPFDHGYSFHADVAETLDPTQWGFYPSYVYVPGTWIGFALPGGGYRDEDEGSIRGHGDCYFWSSTPSENDNMESGYSLYYRDGHLAPVDYNRVAAGLAVRCVPR